MKNGWEFELKALQAAQVDLRRRLNGLDERMDQLRSQMANEADPIFPERVVEIAELPAPILPVQISHGRIMTPPSLPPFDIPVEQPLPIASEPQSTPEPRPAPVAPVTSDSPSESAEGLELKIGKYWLVRIGILVLLTGLVLLGNLAYQSFIAAFGAAGKLSVMGLASVVLLAVGFWLDKRVAKVKNYARVLMAGGAAAIYYTTYAAHFVSSLKVIESPILAGSLLLALAGAFAWFAERRRAQGIAFTAILLTYYTSAINPASQFTLFSNVLLTALAAFLLIRHRWFSISWLALIGSYISFLYWRLHASDSVDLWSSHGFLAAYWILFTLAVFLNRAQAFPLVQRGFFLTVNNAAFFALAAPTVAMRYPQEFWIFCLGYGVVLLALAGLAMRIKRDEPGFDGTYLAQGILMVTLALVCQFTGYQLGVILAVESVALLYLSRFRHAWLYQLFATLAGIAAFILALESPLEMCRLVIAGLLLGNVVQLKWIRQSFGRVDVGATVFALAGMILVGVILGTRFSNVSWIWAFTLAALSFSVAAYFSKIPEIVALAQFYLGLATIEVIAVGVSGATALPFLVGAILLMHGWQHQKQFSQLFAKTLESLIAAGISIVVYLWIQDQGVGAGKMYWFLGVGLGVLLYGCFTRVWALALFSQAFTLTGIYYFLSELLAVPNPDWRITLGGLVIVAIQATMTRRVPHLQAGTSRWIAFAYRASVAVLGLIWLWVIIPDSIRSLGVLMVAVLLFIPAAIRRSSEYLIYAAGFGIVALGCLALGLVTPFSAYHLLAFGLLLVAQQIGKRLLAETVYFPKEFQTSLAVFGIIGIWIELSRWTALSSRGVALTLTWALMAFGILGLGFLLRERSYRLMGLTILSVAVGHVFLFDVWKMGQLAGILSIIALSVILLLLGFVYNRFSDQIRKWL